MAVTKSKPISGDETHTLLGEASTFEGKLVFNGGQVRIDGQFNGEIKATSTLIIGESAKVHANLDVGTVIITGEVEGEITAKHSVGIERPARVKGTITTPELMIQKGVIFEGQCRMEAAAQESDRKITRLVAPDNIDPPKT